MKEFFLFHLIWVLEDFSLRDGDSVLDVFVAPSSCRPMIWSWTYYRGGTGRVVASIYGTGRIVINSTFNQHINFGAVLVCSFGSSSAFWA